MFGEYPKIPRFAVAECRHRFLTSVDALNFKVEITLGEIAKRLGLALKGEGSVRISGIAGLTDARKGELTFLFNSAYLAHLETTSASAVILREEDSHLCQLPCLIAKSPRLEWARIASVFDTLPDPDGEIHPTAVVSPAASIAEAVSIGAHTVIEDGVRVGHGTTVGPGCFLGRNVSLGENSRLFANVTLYHEVELGKNTLVHSGTVVGADGFGFEFDPEAAAFKKIPQIYKVVIGDDVELGANVTIDRGALNDTLIGKGVKLDNQVHIGHGVKVGDHTLISGNTAIGGSTNIGKYCLIGGGVGIIDNIEIVDRAEITSLTFVSRPITQSGRYSSGTGLMTNRDWKRNIVGFSKIDELIKRVRRLESGKHKPS